MDDAYRRIGPVDVLAAGAGCAIGVDAQILVLDLDDFMAATLAQRAFGTGPDKVEDVE